MVTLLSGMVRSNNIVDQSSTIVTTVQPPGELMPTIINENITSPASIWICTINPGYAVNASVVISDAILFTDMLDIQCYTYYIIEKPEFKLQPLEGYINQIDKYPFARLQNQLRIHKYLATQSARSWVYRQPRDGLRQSWQA